MRESNKADNDLSAISEGENSASGTEGIGARERKEDVHRTA